MIGALDLIFGREQPRPERVTRDATVTLTRDEERLGVRGEAEARVVRAIRAGSIGNVEGMIRATALPEEAVTKALNALQDRRIVRRSISGLGTARFEITR